MDLPLVAVNDLTARRRRSGVGHYVGELLRAFPAETPGLQVAAVCDRAAGRPLAWASRMLAGSAPAGGIVAPPLPPPRWRAALSDRARQWALAGLDRYLAAASRIGGWALYHEPDVLAAAVAVPTVVTVHDLGALLHPEWHPARRVEKYEREFRESVGRAKLVLASSANTRRELLELAPGLAGRVALAPLAGRSAFGPRPPEAIAAARAKWGLPPRYVLAVGTIEPRKNHVGLLRAYAQLPLAVRLSCPLALAGAWGWRSDEVRAMLEQAPWDGCVRWLGYVSDEDSVALMCGAAALAFPSLHEGFGMPPLEAMACGVPVVAGRGGAVPEVVGEAALTVESADDGALACALREVLTQPELAAELVRRGHRQAQRFTWRKTAEATLAGYRRALGIAPALPQRQAA